MRAWLLFLLAGCDQILGLHAIDPPSDVAIDAPGAIRPVSGRISQLFVHADAAANPVLENVGYPPNAITLAYETDNSSTNLDTDSNGNFMFMAPAGTYRLALTSQGDRVVRELVFAADTLNVQAAILTRPDAVPVAGATIEAGASLALTGPVLFSTGIWEPELAMISSGMNDYFATWPFDKLEAAKGDRVYAIEYLNPPGASPASNYINAVAPGSVTLMDEQPSVVMGPAVRYDTASPGHQCVKIDPRLPAALMRLGSMGLGVDGEGHEWSVNAFPSDKIAPLSNGMPIAYDEVSLVSDALIENPFNLPLLAISSASTNHLYGATSLGSNISEWHEITVPPTGCPTETFDTIEAPLATSPTLAGIPLDADDTNVDRAGRPLVDLTWQPAMTGIGWEIELAEVGMQAEPVVVHAIITDQTIVKIESSLLVPGRSYVFTISSLAGLTSAANGDFESARFPFARASIVSHPFNVK